MTGKHLAVAVALGLTLASVGLAQMNMSGPVDQGVPSYHAYTLKSPFPATLDPKQFPDALNRNVYTLAAKIKPVLYQQPCYCYCDRHAGHKSLLDCYVGAHGSECDVCQKEAIFAYQQTQKGKTPAQIRAAIIRGEWNSVNMQPYIAAIVTR